MGQRVVDPPQSKDTEIDIMLLWASDADPGCLSRILIFIHPGSRIQKTAKKEKGENLLSYIFCSHKYNKIEIYFIFELVKEKKFGSIYKEL